MKSMIFCLIAVILFASVCLAETLADFNKTGGFEVEGYELTDAGWKFSGTKRWISEQEPRTGKKALKLWDDEEKHNLNLTITKEITGMLPGKYTLSFWCKSGSSSVMAEANTAKLTASNSDSYKEYIVPFTVDKNGLAEISFTFTGVKGQKPWAWLDDISIK